MKVTRTSRDDKDDTTTSQKDAVVCLMILMIHDQVQIDRSSFMTNSSKKEYARSRSTDIQRFGTKDSFTVDRKTSYENYHVPTVSVKGH